MAQTVFEKIISDRGESNLFVVDSAGLQGWHEGEKADPRMRKHAEARNYNITHRSRPIRKDDFEKFDYIVGMDDQNIYGLQQLAKSEEHKAKIYRMTDFLQEISADLVPDPYYGGPDGFEYVIDLLEDACEGFYNQIKSNQI